MNIDEIAGIEVDAGYSDFIDTHHETFLHWMADPENNAAFKKSFSRVLGLISKKLLRKFNGGHIKIFRVMSVKPDFIDQFTRRESVRLGVFWSHKLATVRPPAKGSGWAQDFGEMPHHSATSDVLMTAEANVQAVEWAATLMCFAEFKDFETEIRLRDRAPITLTAMMMDRHDIDIRTFTARTIA